MALYFSVVVMKGLILVESCFNLKLLLCTYVTEFTCNKKHYNKEFNLKGQCAGINYSSEAI